MGAMGVGCGVVRVCFTSGPRKGLDMGSSRSLSRASRRNTIEIVPPRRLAASAKACTNWLQRKSMQESLRANAFRRRLALLCVRIFPGTLLVIALALYVVGRDLGQGGSWRALALGTSAIGAAVTMGIALLKRAERLTVALESPCRDPEVIRAATGQRQGQRKEKLRRTTTQPHRIARLGKRSRNDNSEKEDP